MKKDNSTYQTPYLHEEPFNPIEGDIDNKGVVRGLECLRQGRNIIENRRDDIRTIESNHYAAFSGDPPIGNEFMESTLSYNTIKKIWERLKFLEFDITSYPKKDTANADKILEQQKMKRAAEKAAETGDVKSAMEEIDEFGQ